MTDASKAPDPESGVDDPENGNADEPQVDEQGPGCLPAILAATALMGIVGFIFCAFATWLLFERRTELAIRTLRGSLITDIEQSLLDPVTKAAVVDQLNSLAADMERGKYENWQSAGIMQRLHRLPLLQWGELQAIEAYVMKANGDELEHQLKQLSRLRRAVEMGNATSFEFEDILKPARQSDTADSSGSRLSQPLAPEQVEEVILRAKLVADRENIPDESFDVAIEPILRQEIERGASEGGF